MKTHELYNLLGEIDSEYISDACPRYANKEEPNMKRNIRKKIIYGTLSFAACMALIITAVIGIFTPNGESEILATITIDVNPSIEINVDENERVLCVSPLNEDAQEVIGTMDFEGTSLDVTVHALVGSMVTKGYMTQMKNSVLVSVESENDTTALREKLTSEISSLIGEATLGGSVISQTVNSDDALRELAKEYNISVGKAQLINMVLEERTDKTFEELSVVSITELYLALGEEYFAENNEAVDIEADGAVINKNYYSVEHALKVALDHYGYSENEISKLETELGMVNGTICYTVVFRVETDKYFKNYQVRVNAVTGQFQTGGYSGGAYGENKVPADNVPEGHLTPTEAIDVARQKIGIDLQDAKVTIHLGHIQSEYVWAIDIETEDRIWSMDIYTKTGEIVNYTESAK